MFRDDHGTVGAHPYQTGIWRPAKGNALLVGDAAGFLMPVSGEGIGVGIKSALLAASSIVGAGVSGRPPDEDYLREILPINLITQNR